MPLANRLTKPATSNPTTPPPPPKKVTARDLVVQTYQTFPFNERMPELALTVMHCATQSVVDSLSTLLLNYTKEDLVSMVRYMDDMFAEWGDTLKEDTDMLADEVAVFVNQLRGYHAMIVAAVPYVNLSGTEPIDSLLQLVVYVQNHSDNSDLPGLVHMLDGLPEVTGFLPTEKGKK